MYLFLNKIVFGAWVTFISILIVYLYLNYHTPKGIWVGLQPTIIDNVTDCIHTQERQQDIKNIKSWIINLNNRIHQKNTMYNETIEKLRNISILKEIDKINIDKEITKQNKLKNIEIDFLNDAIKFNEDKITKFKPLTDTNYCFNKNKLNKTMITYKNTYTYFIRRYLFNEDKVYWNKLFLEKYEQKVFK